MIERGKIRIVATPEGATSAEEMFRTIPTPSYLVGLRPRHFEALMRLGSDEEKVERLYSGADDIWKGDDFCDLEDGWAAIHMILNRTPPIDSPFPWDRGEPPLLYALRGTQGVLQGEGMLRDGYEYMVHAVEPTWVPRIAEALPDLDEDSFFALYRAHCPSGWPTFGRRDSRFCWLNYRRLLTFYRAQASTGCWVLFFGEL